MGLKEFLGKKKVEKHNKEMAKKYGSETPFLGGMEMRYRKSRVVPDNGNYGIAEEEEEK
jgi:hypothetical protein|nr:MAG TPA: hypothetical protein [Bacteriophage sp.]